jgi:hypothetical protein
VLLVFIPAGEQELASLPGSSVGMMSASQGHYSSAQLALDIGQGARIASSAYSSSSPAPLGLRTIGNGDEKTGTATTTGTIMGWPAARSRAEAAPQVLTPGALAGQIPGGAGYVGIAGASSPDAPVAADPSGHVAAVSLGAGGSLLERVATLSRSHRLVVADLPAGSEGHRDLLALASHRPTSELLLAIQRTSNPREGQLLWSAAVGLAGGGAPQELTSQSTNQRGLLVSVDIAPTILAWLGRHRLPDEMRGKPIAAEGTLDSTKLRSLMARLRVVGERRLKSLGWLLSIWALLLIASWPWPRARARAIRAGAVGLLSAPVAVLVTAALEPSATVEYLTIALLCLALGALTDLLIPWPRAPLAPAIAGLLALAGDALAHSQLLIRSILGPNPILGARFYGIGNELKSALAVLVFAAVASALYPAVRGRRAAVTMGVVGALLAVIEGSARIGAGVGGVILVCAGLAVAIVLLTPGAVTRKRALIVLVSPVVGLVVLAAIDLLTAHGSGHFTGSVLHASSPGELRDIIVRRYSAAWGELHNHAMPVATLLALTCAVFAIRRRTRLLEPVHGDPAWLAALAGGLAAGLIGSLVEDSGPVLLVVAVFTLGSVLTYLWTGPSSAQSSPDTPRGSRSRALRQPGAPVR